MFDEYIMNEKFFVNKLELTKKEITTSSMNNLKLELEYFQSLLDRGGNY